MRCLAWRVRYRDQCWGSQGSGTVNMDEHLFPEIQHTVFTRL